MADHDVKERSPLAGLAGPKAGAQLEERALLGKLILRGDGGEEFLSKVAGVTGLTPPSAPNSVTEEGDLRLFWLGPDEWLLHLPAGGQGAMMEKLRAALDGLASAVVDVSDYYHVIRLSGEKAKEVLAKGCPLDFHDAVFKTGTCAQSQYAQATVLIHKVSDAPQFDIQIRWSYARYLWDYLTDACIEYGN